MLIFGDRTFINCQGLFGNGGPVVATAEAFALSGFLAIELGVGKELANSLGDSLWGFWGNEKTTLAAVGDLASGDDVGVDVGNTGGHGLDGD